MKKAIKDAPKQSTSDKKGTRPFTAKQKGYTEEVYNNEQQKSYDNSKPAGKKKNTAAPNN